VSLKLLFNAVPRQSEDQSDLPRHWNIYNSINTRHVMCPWGFCSTQCHVNLKTSQIYRSTSTLKHLQQYQHTWCNVSLELLFNAVPRQSEDQLDLPRHWNIYNSINTRHVMCPSSFCLALMNISLMVLWCCWLYHLPCTCWNYIKLSTVYNWSRTEYISGSQNHPVWKSLSFKNFYQNYESDQSLV